MDEVIKERIYVLGAITSVIALFLMIIPHLAGYASYFESIPVNYRIYLFIFLLSVLAIIILNLLRLRAKKYPISIKNDNILYTIEDSTGKLVHCEKNQLMRANYDFIKLYDEEIVVDGEITNIKGSIEGAESTIVAPSEKRGMTWDVQHVFHRQLPTSKYVKRTLSFDFIDSFTKNNEYVLCRILNIIEDFQLSIIFPMNRPPQEIRGFLKRGPIEIEKQKPPLQLYELPDKRKRVDWQIKRPKVGDIYKIIWSW